MEDPVKQMYTRNPLIAFSPLTHIQVTALLSVGEEIKELVARSVTGASTVDGETLNQAYAKLWLWILGAYEVLTTMSQAQTCFTDELASRLVAEKRYLAQLRMPLAKQEFARKQLPSGIAGLLSGIDTAAKDVSFTIGQEVFSAKSIISRFANFVSSIELSQIKASHADAYALAANNSFKPKPLRGSA